MKPELVFVANGHELRELVSALEQQPWIVLDTEFMRERTYFPQLCVIQLATPGILAGIDALAIRDWSVFAELLGNPNITKVFHAARQDIEALLVTLNAIPRPIYDTQIVAALLHGVDQIGYAALVQRVLNVALPKSETRTDWSRRPLLETQWNYAIDDVRYLASVYQRQVETLLATNRLSWFDEDFGVLTNPDTFRPDSAQAWRRIRDATRLSPREQGVLQALAAWREETAIQRDLPRRWVLDDAALIALAREAPDNVGGLTRVRGLPGETKERDGESLVECIASALAIAPDESKITQGFTPLSAQEQGIVASLRAALEIVAASESIPPTVLASRSTLESIARSRDPKACLRGWRAHLLLQPFLRALHS